MHPRSTWVVHWSLSFLACACGSGASAPPARPPETGPRFVIAPAAELLSGKDAQIELRGLAPGSVVEITAERPVPRYWPQPARELYRARASYRVADDGTLTLASAPPLAGSYTGADLRGLFWSMTLTDAPVAPDWPDGRVQLVATQQGRTIAHAALTLRGSLPEVELTTVGAEMPGAVLARLPGPARRPAIIVLGGSDGHDFTARRMAPRLASHGYAVLGLPYYAPDLGGPPAPHLAGLPTALVDIPVDRLDQARDWLRRAPGVDADRIAIWGWSKGAEYALLAATHLPWITAVVAITPTDVVWEGLGGPSQVPGTRSSFSWRGEPLPFVPYHDIAREFMAPSQGKRAALRRPHDEGRTNHPEAVARARIPVERFRGALLVAGGGDDQIWASGTMADNIARSRAAAGLATTRLVYPDAGHMLTGDGWAPTTMASTGGPVFGGTPAADARAQAAVWRETLAFLARALGPVTGSQ
jgi:dienelactone hydrolase